MKTIAKQDLFINDDSCVRGSSGLIGLEGEGQASLLSEAQAWLITPMLTWALIQPQAKPPVAKLWTTVSSNLSTAEEAKNNVKQSVVTVKEVRLVQLLTRVTLIQNFGNARKFL